MRKISYVLIAIGLLIMIYPKANEWINDRKTSSLLATMDSENMLDIPTGQEVQQRNNNLTEILSLGDAEAVSPLESSGPSYSETPDHDKAPEKEKPSSVLATISIDKIKLKLPVLEGATRENMKAAATHLTETTPIGEIGNAAIAAHRARTKGRLFNRLNEIEIGDKIVLTTDRKKFTYTVYKISIVEPTDVTVLNRNNKDRVLTLITCDPLINPTHRLIVQAVMKPVAH